MRINVFHGPTLNLLGTREPEIYGRTTLAEIDAGLVAQGAAQGVTVVCRQSNHEGALIDWILESRLEAQGLIINAGAYSHTSIAIRDAVVATKLPLVEVHLSNLFAREAFRHHSHLSGIALGLICGLGAQGYALALEGLITRLKTA